jgi:hypothetical protein
VLAARTPGLDAAPTLGSLVDLTEPDQEAIMKGRVKLLASAVAISLAIILLGCGGGSTPVAVVPATTPPAVPQITITVSPSSVSLGASETQQFTANVTNTSNTAVTWAVSCSSAPCGTISASGLYTAPSVIPSAVTATVTATSQADSTKNFVAFANHVPLSVRVSPLLAMTMAVGATQTLTASIDKHSNQDVTWSLAGLGCTGTACGALTNITASSATYSAPATFANAATAMVTATSVADNTKSQAVKINLMPMSEPLNGRYAFLFRAADSSTVFAASLVADGKGNLSGIGDLVNASGTQANKSFTGTYTLGADERGTMQITGAGATLTLRMVMLSGNFGRLLDFSGTSDGNGWFEKQNESAFNVAAMNGPWVYLLTGVTGSTFMSRIGDVAFNAACSGSGSEQVNDATWNLFSGGYGWDDFDATCTVDSVTGRGTLVPSNVTVIFATVYAPTMAFYLVDANRALMVADMAKGSMRLSGTMDAYAAFALGGDYSYYVVTPTSVAAGRFTAVPGATANTTAIGGVQDEVSDGGVTLDVPVSGQLTNAGWLSLTLTVGGKALVEPGLYAISPGRLILTGNGFYGEVFLQQGGPFSSASFAGDFGLQFFGRDAHAIGMATLAPPSLTGKADVSNSGLTPAASMNGTISFVSGDRANVSLSTGATGTLPFRGYVVSPKKLLLISTMPGQVTMGWAEKAE